jgi:hypothetical protein
MKLKTNPDKFINLIRSGMIYGKTPEINPIVPVFDKSSVIMQGISADIMSVYIEIKPKFFDLYECKEKEIIAFSNELITDLKNGFKEDIMEISTKDNKIKFRSSRDQYDADLQTDEPIEIPLKFIPVEPKDKIVGYIFEGMKPDVSVIVDANELKLPSAQKYAFIFSKGKLGVKFGNFKRKLDVKEIVGKDDASFVVDGKFFDSISANIEGEVMFAVHKDPEDNNEEHSIIISEVGENYHKTFLLAVME